MTVSQLTIIWLIGENMLDIGMEKLHAGPTSSGLVDLISFVAASCMGVHHCDAW